MREGITFADVLIEPKYSDIESRLDIDVTSKYLGGWRVPIISAPMDTVSGPRMVASMYDLNAYGILHRFAPPPILISNTYTTRYLNDKALFGVSVGVKDFDGTKLWLNAAGFAGIHSVCVDVAHGHHSLVIDTIKRLKEWMYENNYSWHIIVGNVATKAGFWALAQAGADAIRVGIGSGSACTTRGMTGVGIPQLTAIMDCAEAQASYPDVALIADGGIQSPGDMAKALAAGADAVMLGKMLAGADESESVVTFSGDKMYRGQSLNGSNGSRGAPEGIQGLVKATGPLTNTINQLTQYLRSSFSYVGARNLAEFRERVEFIKVSPTTQQESQTRLGV